MEVAESANLPRPLKVLVSEDRLKAWIVPEGGSPGGAAALTVDAILAELKQARIVITDAVRSRAEELVRLIQASGGTLPPEPAEGFLIAEGCPPTEAEDGKLEWSRELAEVLTKPAESEQIDYFAQHDIATVLAGAALGRLIPPRDGTAGIDVHGNKHEPRKLKGTPLKLGAGLTLTGAGGDQVVATTAGQVVVRPGTLLLAEVLDIAGDVDFGTGSLQACVDVHVRGTVRSKFSVHTTQSLHVDRIIEAADVEVGRDLVARGGIFGQERTGRVRAGGQVTAKLLNEVDFEAGGDVRFEKEILNSRVRVLGTLIGTHGTIIGGEIYARERIEVGVLGSEGCVTTQVAVGTEVNTLRRVRGLERRIKELQKSADQIRQTINPLLANKKRLLPAQRERATELLSKADEIELQINELRQQSLLMLQEATPRGAPHFLIAEAIHPGVRLTIHAREVRVQTRLHGPLRIELRKIKDVTEIVAVNRRTSSASILPSVEVSLDLPPTSEPAKKGTKHEADARAVDHSRA
jgi:hypothetical protein